MNETYWTELYLDWNEKNTFKKGYFYDSMNQVHELTAVKHIGMSKNSILIGFMSDGLMNYVCRYYRYDHEIQFYKSTYRQYELMPILIHNVGDDDLMINVSGEKILVDSKTSRKVVYPKRKPQGIDS